jgi:hypothetical protein
LELIASLRKEKNFALYFDTMRLLRSRDLGFEEFEVETAPSYAILSHTWYGNDEEVTYQEMLNGPTTSKPGFQKIQKCGEIATNSGYAYFWVDTCCIDKSSSAELSEALNSMYLWYNKAAVCYVYFSDVTVLSFAPTLSVFRRIKWFKRGWTLQELLAPAEVLFFSKEWEVLGSKEDFKEVITALTGIPSAALEGTALDQFSVAERMSWASKRETKRVEDIAYSLMGIFDVHMPLIYGERERAFIRLQEEIIRSSDDQSIFAWKDPNPSFPAEIHLGLLAHSPNCFAKSKNIYSLGSLSRADDFAITNKGIRINLFVVPLPGARNIYHASLECYFGDSKTGSPSIYLVRLTGSEEEWGSSSESQFARIRGSQIDILENPQKITGSHVRLYVRQIHKANRNRPVSSNQTLFLIHRPKLNSFYYPTSIRVIPSDCWDPQTRIFTSNQSSGKLGAMNLSYENILFLVIFGICTLGNPWVRVIQTSPSAGDLNLGII